MTGVPTEDPLVSALRDAARDLASKRSIRDLDRTIDEIVLAAVATVPRADAGGVSLTDEGTVTARGPSHPSVAELDRLQAELHEGPCITALEEPSDQQVLVAHDLAGPDGIRWPRFAPRAVEAGYRSIMSLGLSTGGGTRGALNLYAAAPDVFDAEARQIAGLFGAQAAILLYGSEQARALQRAVDSRDLIGQAKGILMERFTVDDDAAFEMLVRSSQDTNIKLVDVARWLQAEVRERQARGGPRGNG